MKNFISIITVNYNGKHMLDGFLSSINNLKYPKKLFEMIVVDNGSTDGSTEYISRRYPWVKLIKSKKNLGFGAGNNLGIRNSSGNFVFLINNDTLVDKYCLETLIDCYSRWSRNMKIGAISAKLVLYDKYIPLTIENACFHDYKISKSIQPVNNKLFIRKNNFTDLYTEEVLIPISNNTCGRLRFKIVLKHVGQSKYKVKIGNKIIEENSYFNKNFSKNIKVNLSESEVKIYSLDLLQNTGNYLYRDGYSRDRGTVIVGGKQFFEDDHGQYDEEEIIPAFCGAGVFINKKALLEVELFDEDFFMYYEDVDLSLRLKNRDWQVVYSPRTIVRHIHAASSGEWSKLFIFNAERNRLLFVSKHWPRLIVLLEWLKYITKDMLIIPIYHLFYGEFAEAYVKLRIRMKVNLTLIPNMAKNVFKSGRLTYSDLKKLL